ncbi:MAG: hypothetical protein AAF753_10875 [Pseudomonadota bacterium]
MLKGVQRRYHRSVLKAAEGAGKPGGLAGIGFRFVVWGLAGMLSVFVLSLVIGLASWVLLGSETAFAAYGLGLFAGIAWLGWSLRDLFILAISVQMWTPADRAEAIATPIARRAADNLTRLEAK